MMRVIRPPPMNPNDVLRISQRFWGVQSILHQEIE